MLRRFRDRREAGRLLAERLSTFAGRNEVIVLALPRGGVPVAYEVAMTLHAPLDVFLVRKLGVPYHEELAMGAIASGGVRVLNTEVVQQLGISSNDVERVTLAEQRELERRERAFRGTRPTPSLRDRVVIIVDDGLATGSTMRAAIQALRLQHPAQIVVAVPVGSADTCDVMALVADDCVCYLSVPTLDGVGLWYEDFSQTSDNEVVELLADAARRHLQSPAPAST